MIFIAVKFAIRSDQRDNFLTQIEPFIADTRAESGNVFLEWSKSMDTPDQFFMLEGFESAAAGEAHVNSDHFKAAMEWFPNVFAEPPKIIHVEAPGDGWAEMSEF